MCCEGDATLEDGADAEVAVGWRASNDDEGIAKDDVGGDVEEGGDDKSRAGPESSDSMACADCDDRMSISGRGWGEGGEMVKRSSDEQKAFAVFRSSSSCFLFLRDPASLILFRCSGWSNDAASEGEDDADTFDRGDGTVISFGVAAAAVAAAAAAAAAAANGEGADEDAV